MIEYGGPQVFTAQQISASHYLFEQRHALIYTPTQHIPSEFIGEGVLDVVLPIATPTYLEFIDARFYQTPRLWVDLLQRATGKLRWRPMFPAEVTIIRFDSDTGPGAYTDLGVKAVIDALKVSTSGRSDGLCLHYFGAIVDDSAKHIKYIFAEEIVKKPSEAKTRIVVRPIDKL
jgi:hypothetical protein